MTGAEMPLGTPTDGRGATFTAPEGGHTRAASCVPQTMREPYCTGCGHPADRHRRNACWTDWQGNPVIRARSQVACNCTGLEDDELTASIARHPAGGAL